MYLKINKKSSGKLEKPVENMRKHTARNSVISTKTIKNSPNKWFISKQNRRNKWASGYQKHQEHQKQVWFVVMIVQGASLSRGLLFQLLRSTKNIKHNPKTPGQISMPYCSVEQPWLVISTGATGSPSMPVHPGGFSAHAPTLSPTTQDFTISPSQPALHYPR